VKRACAYFYRNKSNNSRDALIAMANCNRFACLVEGTPCMSKLGFQLLFAEDDSAITRSQPGIWLLVEKTMAAVT